MATQITAWKSSDGTVHESEHEASMADAVHHVDRLAAQLADDVRPPYGDSDAIKRALLEDCGDSGFQYVLRLADAVRALHTLQPRTTDEPQPTLHGPV
jgi:hypothetical protein